MEVRLGMQLLALGIANTIDNIFLMRNLFYPSMKCGRRKIWPSLDGTKLEKGAPSRNHGGANQAIQVKMISSDAIFQLAEPQLTFITYSLLPQTRSSDVEFEEPTESNESLQKEA